LRVPLMTEASTEQTLLDYAAIAREHVLSTCTDKIVPRKSVIYETLVDPTVVKVAGEGLKQQLFTKYGFLKPGSAPIHLASMEKYYEPFIVISARYFLDYYRMCTKTVLIDNDVREVIILGRKFYPEKNKDSPATIRLEGEERLVVEKKAFFMLSKNGEEADLKTLPRAPSEKNSDRAIKKFGIKEIESDADVNFVRGRLVHRPDNLSRIVEEIFEVSERVVIYAPRFRLTYVHAGTFQEKSVEFDGVTAKRIDDENLHSRVARAFKSTFDTDDKK